jgi:hypothetical protein
MTSGADFGQQVIQSIVPSVRQAGGSRDICGEPYLAQFNNLSYLYR